MIAAAAARGRARPRRGHDRHPRIREPVRDVPRRDWDALRGVGATIAIPVSSVGRGEPALSGERPRIAGEQVLVQTFATAVLLALERVDGQHLRFAAGRGVRRRDARRPVAEHVRGGEPHRVLRGGRPGLVRRETRRVAARRQPQRDQHARRAARSTIRRWRAWSPSRCPTTTGARCVRSAPPDVRVEPHAMLFAIAPAGMPAAMPGRPSCSAATIRPRAATWRPPRRPPAPIRSTRSTSTATASRCCRRRPCRTPRCSAACIVVNAC